MIYENNNEVNLESLDQEKKQKWMSIIGKKLANLRDLNNVTLEVQSESTRLSISTLSAIERAERAPSMESMIKLAEYWNIEPSFLFDTQDIPKDKIKIWYNFARLISKKVPSKNFEAIKALIELDSKE